MENNVFLNESTENGSIESPEDEYIHSEEISDCIQSDNIPEDDARFDHLQTAEATIEQEHKSDIHVPAAAVQKPTKKKKLWGIIALVLVFALLGSVLGSVGTYYLFSKKSAEEQNSSATDNPVDISSTPDKQKPNGNLLSTILEGRRDPGEIQTVDVSSGVKMTPAEVYKNCVMSAVGIKTQIVTNYWGYQTTTPASGSGLIYTDDGYVLTNYHVIEDATEITVMTYDDRSFTADLIGYDQSNDIAVLKIEAEELVPAVIGDSSLSVVGEQVVAIGNPLGELTFSLTSGYISALDREITLSGNITMNLIQTDCAINSGNSGGPLFNLYGEVIGITNAKMSSSGLGSASIDNIGFAIPINTIRHIVDSIIEKGYYSKPYIGVTVSNVGEEAQRYGAPAGAAVYSITEDSPAQESGLQVNDIIVEVNGEAITGSSELVNAVSDCEIGDELNLRVYRNGEYLTLTLTVGESIQTIPSPEEKPAQGYDYGNGYDYDFPFGFGFPWGF